MPHPLPSPVGANSALVLDALAGHHINDLSLGTDPFDRDTQLAWFILNELSFGGWEGVSDNAEWQPTIVALRSTCDAWFTSAMAAHTDDSEDPQDAVARILSTAGPSISQYLAQHGTAEQVAESLLLRFPYQYKEADPHTFAIPRLDGPVKRALCEIQAGEYGVGHRFSHAELYREALASLGVNEYTPTIDHLPGVAFATSNLVSMAGLNRSKRGVAIGQLALFEMDSVGPNQNMVLASDRLGLPADVRRFFHIHVMADAEHEVIAKRAFLVDYPRAEPDQRRNVTFGIHAQHAIDVALADHAIAAWRHSQTALTTSADISTAA